MAPTIPTAGANTLLFDVTATNNTSHTFPSLTTLDNASGDLLIAICVVYQVGATTTTFSSWGAGFTEFGELSSATNPSVAMAVAYKISDGTESGLFAVTTNTSFRSAQCLMSVKNWHGTTPPEVAFSAQTAAVAQDPPNLDPSWSAAAEDILWIAVAGGGQESLSGTWTGIASAPTNYTGYAESAIAGGDVGGATQVAVAFRQLNGTAEDPGAFTTDTTPERELAATIAVRPTAAVDGTATPAAITVTATQNGPRAAWAPPVTGCIAQYDASNAPSITDAGGGAVSAWSDIAATPWNDLTQTTGANRPTTGTRTQNGRNVIDFDGTNDFLISSAMFTQAQPITVFAVVNHDVVTSGQCIWASGGPTQYVNGANLYLEVKGSTTISGAYVGSNAPVVISSVANGASSEIWQDGVSLVSGNPGTNGLSGSFGFGSYDLAGGNLWDGWIAEILVYPSALGTTDRQNIETYLGAKWGTAAGVDGTATPASILVEALAGSRYGRGLYGAGLYGKWVHAEAFAAGGDGTATPAAVAVTINQNAVAATGSATASPSSMTVTATTPAASAAGGGSGSAAPGSVTVSVTTPQAAASGGATASPAAISRTITLNAVTATGGGVTTPAAKTVTVTLNMAAATGSATATPSSITVIVTVPQAAASGGGAGNAAPGPIALSITTPQATATGGATTTPAAISRTITVDAATATVSVTATPTAISRTVTLNTAAATGTAVATPAAISVTVTVPVAAASGGSVGTAAPGPIAISVTRPQPVATGGATTTPAVISRTVTVNPATVTVSNTATPAAIARTVTVNGVTATGETVATPATIQATVTVNAVTASGTAGGIATPAAVLVTILFPLAQPPPQVFPNPIVVPAADAALVSVPVAESNTVRVPESDSEIVELDDLELV